MARSKGGLISLAFPNARAIERALHDLAEYAGSRTAKASMKRGLRNSAQPVVVMAKRLAPRADHPLVQKGKVVQPGTMASKIQVSYGITKRQKRSRSPLTTKDEGESVAVYVGLPARGPGVLIEWGTGPRYTKAGSYRGMGPAIPFMRPAWEANKTKVLDDFAKALWEDIRKTAERARRRHAKKGGGK